MLRAHDSCYPKSLICLSSALFPTPSPTNNFKLKCLSFLLRIDNLLFFDVSFFQNLFSTCGRRGRKKLRPNFCYCTSLPFLIFTYCIILILFRLLYCLKSRSWAQFSRLENFSGLILLDAELRQKSMSILLSLKCIAEVY